MTSELLETPGELAPTVLLIEDNPADARLIREMLREAPGTRFRLEWAEGLAAGLETLAGGSVDLVLLDLSLPESQGLQTFFRLRDRAADVPVVVLTGLDDEDLGNRAVHAGAQDYLIKGKVGGELLGRALRYAIERGKTEQELRRRAQQLADMDRRKDEFLATLAHELRNPLAPLRNALHVLRLASSRVQVEQIYEMMERQVGHMVRLVDDLLEISRITRGKIQLRREMVDLAAVVQSAVETSQPLIDAAGHHLSVSLPTEPLYLHGDSTRLAQVLTNLLNNAAKYTEQGGQIRLRIERAAETAVISVRDTGVGIPPEMLPRVFDIFAQVDRTLNRAQGGLGIGLTLVRTLVELHGGTIEAHSGGLGQGSEFLVRLPLRNTQDAAVQPSSTGEPGRPIRNPRRILVVDDNHDVADSLGMLLQYLGADAQVVYDGPSAIEAVHASRPSAVLLDIGMPGMNGHEVARRLREEPANRDLMLVALTGWGQEEDRSRSKAAGFDNHLVKPVDAQTLQALLASLPG